MGIGFLMIVPVLFWLFIVMLIIAVSKPKRRPQQNYRKDSAPQRYQHTARKSFERPKMQEGLFDIKLGKTKLTLSGLTGLDQSVDYNVAVALPQITLHAKIGGTFSSPKITLDTARSAEAVLEKAGIDKEQVGEQVGEGEAV